MNEARTLRTQCCVVGGGPAGIMLGLLLSRAGVDVVVLEKHANFLRDFRGDTVHPSTLEVLSELGLYAAFLERPHQELAQLGARIGGTSVRVADFSRLPTRARFVALMPQWDFLDFLAEQALRAPTFHLEMRADVVDLLRDGARIAGVRAMTPDGVLEVRSDLTVGADGRSSIVREKAGLTVREIGAPIDVLWMRLSRREDDTKETLGYVDQGHFFVTLNRGSYWQCAFVIPKGAFDELRREPIERLHDAIVAIVPFLRERVRELGSWDDVKLLTVRVDRLRRWSKDGVLCIGDAAHAMSPVGGVGINLAIQDAVAAANVLARPLREGTTMARDLRRVQRRRTVPTRMTQRLQRFVQDRIVRPSLERRRPKVPLALRLLDRSALLRRMPARLIGLGMWREHVGDEILRHAPQ